MERGNGLTAEEMEQRCQPKQPVAMTTRLMCTSDKMESVATDILLLEFPHCLDAVV